ncbi:MAG: RDD family protein [Woeseia sp.]|jgi:uncharacterized RDD family membrane protein YckC|nr:RDD family protein [Woeseia sp.]MBT6211309.1 RDD family protein [Woeseia sp.]
MHNTGLLRRLGAMIYDGLLLVALMFLATLPFIALRGGEPVEPGELLYQIVLLLVSYLFFVGFWSRSGRTLGMQAWRIQVEAMSGDSPSITALNVRFFTAIVSLLVFGMGFWWQLFDREGLTWHDRLSRTRLRYYPKPEE